MPEGGPRGESTFAQGSEIQPNTAEKTTDAESDDLGAEKRRKSVIVEIIQEKILRGEINFDSPEDFKLALANEPDQIPASEQARLANIFTVTLERKKTIERVSEEGRRLNELINTSEASLVGNFTRVEELIEKINTLDPKPPEEVQSTLLKQYELARNAREAVLATQREQTDFDQYRTTLEDTFRNGFASDGLLERIDEVSKILPPQLSEDLRESIDLLSTLPSATRNSILFNPDGDSTSIREADRIESVLRTAMSRGRVALRRDVARSAANKIVVNFLEKAIIDDISSEECAAALPKIKYLETRPAAPTNRRLAELEQRAQTVGASDELKVIYGRLKRQLRPNFDAIFESIDRLSTFKDVADVAVTARMVARERELSAFESQCEPFTEPSAISTLDEQLFIISQIPDRDKTYTHTKEELTKRAYDREVASIQLAYSSAPIEEIRRRIKTLPPELQPVLRNEYQTYRSIRTLEALEPEEANAGAKEAEPSKPKVNFLDVKADGPRSFDPAREPATVFIDNYVTGFFSGRNIGQLNNRIDQIGNEISPGDNFRLKKLAAAGVEIAQLDEERGRARDESNEACKLALKIAQGRLNPSAVTAEIDRNSFPPALADRLLELSNIAEKFTTNRVVTQRLAESYRDISSFADRILANEFLTRGQFEAVLNDPGTNFPGSDVAKLTMLFEMVRSLPTKARVALNENVGARDFDNTLFQKVRDTLLGLAKGQSKDDRRSQEQTLKDAEQAVQFITIRRRVAEQINQGQTTEALSLLSTYAPLTTEDQIEINTLCRLALERKIDEQTEVTLARLGRDSADFNRVDIELSKLSQLRGTNDINPLELCQTIRSLATVRETDAASYAITPITLSRESRYEDKLLDIEQELPIRDNKYLEVIGKLKTEALENEYASIELCFYLETANTVLGRIARLPESTKEQLQRKKLLFQEFVDFIAEKKAERPEDFAITSEVELSQVLQREEYSPRQENLGINTRGYGIMKLLYRRGMGVLVERLRNTKATQKAMERIVPKIRTSEELRAGANSESRRLARAEANKFRRRVRNYRQQRELSEREIAYIKSVELATAFNPPMVAAARADFGTTSAFVREALAERSRETKTMLRNGMHIPVLIVGGGPGGMATIDELMRTNPELAAQALLIDDADQLGGPFGVPQGAAWELNSASGVGDTEFIPDSSDEDSIRGSSADPTIGYPGERRETNPDTRDFSINRTTSAGPSPEQIAPGRRYVTNEELEITNDLEAAVLLSNLSLKTKLIKVSPVPTKEFPLRKKVILEINDDEGNSRTVEVTNDLCIVSSGLGRETFGFEIENTDAERVLAASGKRTGVPLLSTYLKFFKALVDRTKRPEEKEPGETVVIYGNGDSRRTMEEQLTRLFAESGPNMAKIKKVYVIANGEDSARPRYLKRKDVQARINRQSIVTIIEGKRVNDVSFAPGTKDKLNVSDQDGNFFTDPNTGEIIVADHVVSTAGFKPENDEVFADYAGGQSLKEKIDSVTLPANQEVAIADKLKTDPGVIFVQTASRPQFNEGKLKQLPEKSRAALLAVGPENAVAIDYRIHDTKAAVNNTLAELGSQIERTTAFEVPKVIVKSLRRPNISEFEIACTIDPENYRVQDNADASRTASALLSLLLHKYEFTIPRSRIPETTLPTAFPNELNETFKFSMRLRQDNPGSENRRIYWDVTSTPVNISRPATPVPKSLAATVADALQNETFQSYCAELISSRNSKEPEINLALSFKNGRIQPAESYVE